MLTALYLQTGEDQGVALLCLQQGLVTVSQRVLASKLACHCKSPEGITPLGGLAAWRFLTLLLQPWSLTHREASWLDLNLPPHFGRV